MSLTHLRFVVVTTWLAALLVGIGASMAFGLVASPWDGAVIFLVGCIPALFVPVVFRGASAQTIAQALYDSGQTPATPNARLYSIVKPRERP